MKIAILYYSKTGNTKRMAQTIADGAQTVEGVQAQTFPIDAIDEAFVKESSCVILGTPVYLAGMCTEAKIFLDRQAMKLGLAGKIGGAFATADYLHGGGDIAIQSILSHMMVFGMLVYSGGGAHGKPPIHLGPVALGGGLEASDEVFRLYGQRMATKTKELFGV